MAYFQSEWLCCQYGVNGVKFSNKFSSRPMSNRQALYKLNILPKHWVASVPIVQNTLLWMRPPEQSNMDLVSFLLFHLLRAAPICWSVQSYLFLTRKTYSITGIQTCDGSNVNCFCSSTFDCSAVRDLVTFWPQEILSSSLRSIGC